jgi:hypothetical protein
MPGEEYKIRKRNYITKYNKGHYRSINVLFRVDDEVQVELWKWLHTKYSTAGFLRDLALKEMQKEKEGK